MGWIGDGDRNVETGWGNLFSRIRTAAESKPAGR
jgi:hypothetical protein